MSCLVKKDNKGWNKNIDDFLIKEWCAGNYTKKSVAQAIDRFPSSCRARYEKLTKDKK